MLPPTPTKNKQKRNGQIEAVLPQHKFYGAGKRSTSTYTVHMIKKKKKKKKKNMMQKFSGTIDKPQKHEPGTILRLPPQGEQKKEHVKLFDPTMQQKLHPPNQTHTLNIQQGRVTTTVCEKIKQQHNTTYLHSVTVAFKLAQNNPRKGESLRRNGNNK